MRTWRVSDGREQPAGASGAAADKLWDVLAGMQPGVEVSDLCRREGLNPVQYYAWKKQLLGSAAPASRTGGVARREQQRREAEARRLKGRDRRDHRGEPRPKKGAPGLEDHGQLPPELQ